MKASEYHSIPAVSSSLLRTLKHGAAYLAEWLETPQVSSEPMLIGTSVHGILSGTFDEEVAVFDGDRRTKEGKIEYARILESGKAVINRNQYELTRAISKAIQTHPVASKLLDGCEFEKSFFWSYSNLDCKARIDFIGETYLGDFKITSKFDPKRFKYSVLEYEYHLQAAWYNNPCPKENFYWIVASSSTPVQIFVYRAKPETIEQGRKLWLDRIEQYSLYKEWNHWPLAKQSLEIIDI